MHLFHGSKGLIIFGLTHQFFILNRCLAFAYFFPDRSLYSLLLHLVASLFYLFRFSIVIYRTLVIMLEYFDHLNQSFIKLSHALVVISFHQIIFVFNSDYYAHFIFLLQMIFFYFQALSHVIWIFCPFIPDCLVNFF